jgi:hypothetical protein
MQKSGCRLPSSSDSSRTELVSHTFIISFATRLANPLLLHVLVCSVHSCVLTCCDVSLTACRLWIWRFSDPKNPESRKRSNRGSLEGSLAWPLAHYSRKGKTCEVPRCSNLASRANVASSIAFDCRQAYRGTCCKRYGWLIKSLRHSHAQSWTIPFSPALIFASPPIHSGHYLQLLYDNRSG